MNSWVGKSSPAYASSLGKTLLAGLPDSEVLALCSGEELEAFTPRTLRTLPDLLARLEVIRRSGYALDDEELEIGLRCVSAPLFGPNGRVDGAIGVSGPSQRLTLEAVGLVAEHVRWWTTKANIALGVVSAPDGWAPFPTVEPGALDWVERVRKS
jgi:DNA-binding IclR family transcriptional regulator